MKLQAIIIDDDPRDISTLKVLIENYCDDVEVIGDAFVIDDGFKLIREKKPDVVFLDIHMPRGEGHDLLERFPKRNFDVIIISGSGGYVSDMSKYHVFKYIMKPVDTDNFKDTIHNLKAHREKNPEVSYKIF